MYHLLHNFKDKNCMGFSLDCRYFEICKLAKKMVLPFIVAENLWAYLAEY
jgi:hypothetical protein